MMTFKENDAPILVVLGQSNALGHGTKLDDKDIIRTPLKNVYGLSREDNQAYGLSDIKWSGFKTSGFNLGETQDDTACLSNYFASMWQNAIDNGNDLPDLYIIHISVGAQGVCEKEMNGYNMWYPFREPVMKPGGTYECDISLYPFTTEILSLAAMNLIEAGKRPRVIGLHWNQWETECLTGESAMSECKAHYENIFWGFFTALGSGKTGKSIPFYLYRPLSEVCRQEDLDRMSEIFEDFTHTYESCKILDLRTAPFYDDTPRTHGIFEKDGMHYSPQSQLWFAMQQWSDIFER